MVISKNRLRISWQPHLPPHGISADIYASGYGQGGSIKTGNLYTYNGESYVLPLGTPSPLFWVQYSYLGLNPHFSDAYANYWDQNVNATLINHAYCVADPNTLDTVIAAGVLRQVTIPAGMVRNPPRMTTVRLHLPRHCLHFPMPRTNQ